MPSESRYWRTIAPNNAAADLVLHVDQDNSDRILCVQHWTDRASYEAYVGWRKENGDLNILDKVLGGHPLAETPIIRFFDPTDA